MSLSFEPKGRVGPEGRYELVMASSAPGLWRARDVQTGMGCRLRALKLPLPERAEPELREREKQRLSKDFERWREVSLARPETLAQFWEEDTLCWVEASTRGAPLSSLTEALSTLDALSLIEEVLFTLDDHHNHLDFMTGEPLLHLNIHPTTILRGAEGRLLLMDPLTPSWVSLSAQHRQQRLEELEGAYAPELTRGRCEPSSDLYALGMSVLSAMAQVSLKRVDQRLNAGRLLSHDLKLAPSVQRFFEGLVNFRASERLQSPEEALSALRSLPRELYEPLNELLERSALPSPLVGEAADQAELRESTPRASVRVSDEENEAFDAFERGEDQAQVAPALDGEARRAPLSDLEAHERREGGDLEVSRALIIVDEGGDQGGDRAEESVGYAFYTRAHEPRDPRKSKTSGSGITEVEVIEEPQRRWLIYLLAGLSLLSLIAYSLSSDAPPKSSSLLGSQRGSQRGSQQGSQQGSQRGSQQASEGKATLHDSKGSRERSAQATLSAARGSRAVALSALEQTRRSGLPDWVRLEGGEVWVGALEGEGYADEHPRRRVKVEAFELGKTEVTVRQYMRCVEGGACDVEKLKTPDWGDASQCNWDHPERYDHPMNCVSWRQALDYARWVGGRLPSEAEWSFAAQGGREAPAEGLRYPWGQKSRGCGYAVLHHRSRGDGCGEGGTAPVCSARSGDSAQGLCDLIGNVWEWMTDEYHPSYQDAPVDAAAWALRPLDRWSLVERSLRGSAFDERDLPRVARRNHYSGGAHLATVGFRVARDLSRSAPERALAPLIEAESAQPEAQAAPEGSGEGGLEAALD